MTYAHAAAVRGQHFPLSSQAASTISNSTAHLVLEPFVAANAGEAGSWWNSTANCLAAEKTKFQSELFLEFLLRIQLHEVTSSTAQGGGGSFKNRKPIGEIGCCESGMAERIH